MKVNDIISNFKVEQIKRIDDVDSTMYVLKHQLSKATLVYLENEDTNKCFAFGFKTISENSTGIPHIIEHSVLCGSKKFPLKEPFVNLLKGSMATFLNAFTADDFTMYPVASVNDSDFNNLMSVYMDAVLCPLSVEDDKPFLQEGWHYELADKDALPTIKGVVYNEMKGALAPVTSQLMYAANAQLYKGSNYEFNSGGDPEVIPTLTYDYYKSFYKKHYHPSNGLIYLYGKMDIEEKLKFLDEEYLSKYKDDQEKVVIKDIKPLINTEYEQEFALEQEQDLKDNTYFALSYGLCKYENALDLKGLQILDEVLMGTNDSQLKKALLDAKLGQDISSYINDDCITPSYHLMLTKSNKDCKDKFYNTFIEACKKIVKEGVDKKALLATINNAEFKNKEMDSGSTPKGLFLSFNLMQSFNYNVPFENYLEYSRYFEFFKKEMNNGYFESLIEKYFLNSKHYTLITLKPSKEKEANDAKRFAEKMKEVKASWSEKDIEDVLALNARLNEYQSKQDTKEELAVLPTLTLDEIGDDVETLITKEETKEGINYLVHNFNTNGIGYLKMYFDMSTLTLEQLPYMKLLVSFLIDLDSKNYKANDLQSQIKTYLGDLVFSFNFYSKEQNNSIPKFIITASALKDNINKIAEMINEVVENTIYDEEKMHTMLLQIQEGCKNSIISNGMGLAILANRAASSKQGVYNAVLSGYEYYSFIKQINANYNGKEIADKLKEIINILFNKNNLLVSVSGDDETIELLQDEVNKLHLNDVKHPAVLDCEIRKPNKTAIIIPSQVSYNSVGTNLTNIGYAYSGTLNVLSHILRYDYLWNNVRVKGGAYGTTISATLNGDIALGSYRDPNVANTYNVYANIADYVKNLSLTDDQLRTYIIGCVGNFQRPGSNNTKIGTEDFNHIINRTVEERKALRKDMVNTTLDDIKALSDLFNKLNENESMYTIGNQEKIKDFNQFDTIKSL